MHTNKKTYAVVVGLGINGLGIVRALGIKGLPLIKVDVSSDRPGMLSRYGDKFLVKSLSEISLIDELEKLFKELLEPPVLFVTEEAPLNLISKYRERLLPLCKILLPSNDVLEQLTSKEGIDKISADCGFIKPKTVHIGSLKDQSKLASLRFPCILKPGRKSIEYGKQFKKGYRVKSIDEAILLIEKIIPVLPDIVVQEWIEGQSTDIYFTIVFISDTGELVTSFTGKKLRSWPVPVGGTASCIPDIQHHEKLVSLTYAFFKAVNFKGLGGVEFKKDSRDGKFYLIEPTVSRTDFQHEVTILNGVNFPFVIYQYHNREEIERQQMIAKYAWLESTTERWAREATGVSDDLLYKGFKKVNVLFRWQDPVPWVYSRKKQIFSKIRMLMHKAFE